ncbi:MAG: hypothetical protein AMXMBFR84_25320 [Candidatus Hydrogenedentota bacterium]
MLEKWDPDVCHTVIETKGWRNGDSASLPEIFGQRRNNILWMLLLAYQASPLWWKSA